MVLVAISVSRDDKWIANGTASGASVWDAELREKVIDVKGTSWVYAVDVSPDSTRFATGSDKDASIWNISSGERLVGPLEHDSNVRGIRFSPNGDQLATTCDDGSVRIFDSRTGDSDKRLITIEKAPTITPLVWSNDGQQIFATSKDNKIQCFDVSTWSQRAESQILKYGNVESIALATNGKFIAAYAGRTIFFLDASSLARIGPVIEGTTEIYSIAISPDGQYLATGGLDGRVIIRNLASILPDLYGPFRVSIWPALCLPR